jgi:hypothetical protein
MARWQGSTTERRPTGQRGYGSPHQKLRARWKPLVDAGRASCHAVICLMPYGPRVGRAIPPGEPWNLGHTPDRTAYTGPEHEKCNKSDGARRGNRMRGRQQQWITSRRW